MFARRSVLLLLGLLVIVCLASQCYALQAVPKELLKPGPEGKRRPFNATQFATLIISPEDYTDAKIEEELNALDKLYDIQPSRAFLPASEELKEKYEKLTAELKGTLIGVEHIPKTETVHHSMLCPSRKEPVEGLFCKMLPAFPLPHGHEPLFRCGLPGVVAALHFETRAAMDRTKDYIEIPVIRVNQTPPEDVPVPEDDFPFPPLDPVTIPVVAELWGNPPHPDEPIPDPDDELVGNLEGRRHHRSHGILRIRASEPALPLWCLPSEDEESFA